jgi:hypothetical protein
VSTQCARPKWWQLYLTFPLLIALFVFDHRLIISQHGHQAVQIGILLVVFGLIHLWLKANAMALSKMDRRQFHGTVAVIRVPLYQLSDTRNDKRPMLHLPDSELKGTLGDTFEMDYIDAEFIPVDEAVGDLKKE